MRALADLAPREVALAPSKIDDGAHPDERAMDLMLMVAGTKRGIGWRKRCDLPATMSSRMARTMEVLGH
jgi:hypothetical protein